MSDPRDDEEIAEDADREDFAPLEASDLRGDEVFEDEPAIPDEPEGVGADLDDEIADEPTT
jgi:hypothetical protein